MNSEMRRGGSNRGVIIGGFYINWFCWVKEALGIISPRFRSIGAGGLFMWICISYTLFSTMGTLLDNPGWGYNRVIGFGVVLQGLRINYLRHG